MKVLLSEKTQDLFEKDNVVTLGAFDGFHIGHQALVHQALDVANKNNYKTFVFSFLNHPQSVIKPQNVPLPIITYDEKLRICNAMGVDYLALIPFSLSFSQMTPEAFLDMIRVQYRAAAIVVGFNFHFGKQGAGNPQFLKEYCEKHNIEAHVVEPVLYGGQVVSSSRIRSCIMQGEMEEANAMLGRPYGITSKVLPGHQLGRTMGYRTANIAPGLKVLPQYGVYVTRAIVYGTVYQAITNVGTRPTVSDEAEVTVETHLFDCDIDLYEQNIRIEFLHKIREERRFESVEALKKRIALDVSLAKEYFTKEK